jgi:fumarylacetoacetate (FAA) hydrolase family protein
MKYFFANDIKDGFVFFKSSLVAAHKNRQAAQGSHVHRIGDGRF